jgi:hypothetical protein
METTYKASGYVLGNHWGGGEGAYPTIRLEADTFAEVLAKCNNALEDGSLDSGMGFERLIGAIINVTTITTIVFEDKDFINKEVESHFIGELTEEQEEFLTIIYE